MMNKRAENNKIKCVLVGDCGVGKASLVRAYAQNLAGSKFVQNDIVGSYCATVMVDGIYHNLEISTTVGHSDYDHLRPLVYPQTDVFLVCYSAANVQSYENVKEKWLPEVRAKCPIVPIILVATKIDLRQNKGQDDHRGRQQLITYHMGQTLAASVKASAFIENSASSKEGVKKTFDLAVNLALQNEDQPLGPSCQDNERTCIVL